MRKQHSTVLYTLPCYLSAGNICIFYAKVCGWHHLCGILEQSMRARNREGKGLSYRPVWIGGIDSLKSISGLLKRLQIRALSCSQKIHFQAVGTLADHNTTVFCLCFSSIFFALNVCVPCPRERRPEGIPNLGLSNNWRCSSGLECEFPLLSELCEV